MKYTIVITVVITVTSTTLPPPLPRSFYCMFEMEVCHFQDGIQPSKRAKIQKCVRESEGDTPLSYLHTKPSWQKRIVAVYWENSIPDELPGNQDEADRKESLTGWSSSTEKESPKKKTHLMCLFYRPEVGNPTDESPQD